MPLSFDLLQQLRVDPHNQSDVNSCFCLAHLAYQNVDDDMPLVTMLQWLLEKRLLLQLINSRFRAHFHVNDSSVGVRAKSVLQLVSEHLPDSVAEVKGAIDDNVLVNDDNAGSETIDHVPSMDGNFLGKNIAVLANCFDLAAMIARLSLVPANIEQFIRAISTSIATDDVWQRNFIKIVLALQDAQLKKLLLQGLANYATEADCVNYSPLLTLDAGYICLFSYFKKQQRTKVLREITSESMMEIVSQFEVSTVPPLVKLQVLCDIFLSLQQDGDFVLGALLAFLRTRIVKTLSTLGETIELQQVEAVGVKGCFIDPAVVARLKELSLCLDSELKRGK